MDKVVAERPAWGRVPYDIESRREWLRMPFEEGEYTARWKTLGQRLAKANFSALIAFGRPGDSGVVRYLTNFESYVGHTAAVVSPSGSCAIATNSLMRAEPMQSGIWMTCVEDVRPTANRRYMPDAPAIEDLLIELLEDYGEGSGDIAVCGPLSAGCLEALGRHRPNAKVVDWSAELAGVMAVKSAAEIHLLRRANEIADSVLDRVMENLRPGINESELAGLAFGEMMRLGAEGPSFPLALTAGRRTGLKHASPTDYVLAEGDMFFVDFGLTYDGYMTDNARSGVIGKATEEQLDFLNVCKEMTAAAASIARPGVEQQALDDAAFAVARELGFAEDYYFRAHGVGTALFLPPRFVPGDRQPVRPGEVFSLEPMLVRHGFGTACVENTVLVTDGGSEVLNCNPARWW